jgi:RHS repeat-associated protein
MTSVASGGQTTSFTYDGDGARVKKVEPGNITTLYIGPVEITINATQRITKTYYSAGAQMVAMRTITSTGGNTLYFLHTDHLGSTSLSTNSSGVLVAGSRQSYYPFGAIRTAASSLPTDITFTGQRRDVSTGLMFYNARYYDPVVGRFVSADTIVPDAANPQSFNRFSYVRNNPLKYIDPSGHAQTCPDSECGATPVGLIDLATLGIRLGIDVDPLVYSFYRNPERFDVTASVEFSDGGIALSAKVMGIFLGQGKIPDQESVREHYPVRSTITQEADGTRRWLREVLVDDEYQVVFNATWKFRVNNGRPEALETFDLPALAGGNAAVHLAGATDGKSLTWSSLMIGISPAQDGSGYEDAMKMARLMDSELSIAFETRQTGLNTIQSVGRLTLNGRILGEITFDGRYR